MKTKTKKQAKLDSFDGSRTYKFKNKRYARPVILNYKDFAKAFRYDFETLNPGVDYDEFWRDL